MAGRGSADVVFVIDSSRSMEPCIEGVKRHVSNFVEVFRDDPNCMWDLRLDFIAHDDQLVEDRAVGVDRDFQERVVTAGGRYKDVDVRATLIWNDRNDLDLHVVAPSGEEIYYRNKRSACGGELDVDRNVHGETRQPVENVRWAAGSAPSGRYRVYVQNFNYHESHESPVRFRVEVVQGDQVSHFDGVAHGVGDKSAVEICSFDFDGSRQRNLGAASGGFRGRSAFESSLLDALYHRGGGLFFTDDVAAFQGALGAVRTGDNESSLVALDCSLDMPWRDSTTCHRVVVLLTDEPLEGGNRQAESLALIDEIIAKIQRLRVMLFLVTPQSDAYEQLSGVDKCEWNVVDGGDGLASVDFRDLLVGIGKSVSVSQAPLAARGRDVRRALFGQSGW